MHLIILQWCNFNNVSDFLDWMWFLHYFQKQPSRGVKLFLEISQNFKENICARVSFLLKLQASGLNLEFGEISKNTFSYRTPPVAASLFLIAWIHSATNFKTYEQVKVHLTQQIHSLHLKNPFRKTSYVYWWVSPFHLVQHANTKFISEIT